MNLLFLNILISNLLFAYRYQIKQCMWPFCYHQLYSSSYLHSTIRSSNFTFFDCLYHKVQFTLFDITTKLQVSKNISLFSKLNLISFLNYFNLCIYFIRATSNHMSLTHHFIGFVIIILTCVQVTLSLFFNLSLINIRF